MNYFKIFQTIVVIAMLCYQSNAAGTGARTFSWLPFFGWGGGNTAGTSQPEVEAPVERYEVSPNQEVEEPAHHLTRGKRSFSWPSFLGGGGSTEVEAPEVAAASDQIAPQQNVEIPAQQVPIGYHYPIWRVHKYNGIELKPMPISLVNRQHVQHLQKLYTRVPHTQLQQRLHFRPNQGNIHLILNRRENNQLPGKPNCTPKAIVPIPPELQDLADKFGIKDASKLPSLEDAMNLLGTTTRAETIQTIRELAATPDGMSLIRQFLATDEGAAASEDPNANTQCNDTPTQQFTPQLPNNINRPHQQIQTPNFHHEATHQQFPNLQPPKQHETYGLPNVQPATYFHAIDSSSQNIYPPQTNIMSLVKSEGIPHEEYGVPNEIVSTAHSEYQGYNLPNQSDKEVQHGGHETYGLPNLKPAVSFRQNYYAPSISQEESVKSDAIPHKEYNVPNAVSSSDHEIQEPHQEYGVPIRDESHGSEQQQGIYDLPKNEELVNFQSEGKYPPPIPHDEYGVPKTVESNASDQSVQQHEEYGLPMNEEAVNFHSQGFYPPSVVEDTISDHQTQVPHEVYGLPNQEQVPPHADSDVSFIHPHEVYAVPEQTNVQHNEQNLSVPHQEYALPTGPDTHNFAQHESYALPHQQFFDQQNTFNQQQSTQYGTPTKYNSNNVLTSVPILRQVDGALDRTHTSLQIGQLLTTTARPNAGFLERVTSWTNYFTPPGPTIPIVPPQVTEDVQESAPPSPNAYTIPIPKIPEISEPQIPGLPPAPQLPNVYIPKKFFVPSTGNQGPFFRPENPRPAVGNVNEHALPHLQPQPFDGQTVEEFVPDVSHLPLDDRNLGHDLRTSYGIRTHPKSYAADSSHAASETNEQLISVVSAPNQSGRHLDQIEIEEIVGNDVVDEKQGKKGKKYGPQRISPYDSYATGKLNRANADAINKLIPTQKPTILSRIEDASMIDAIATMTSGFRPMT